MTPTSTPTAASARAYTNSCPQNYKFEGKERDAESGNDDFGARYYSNRFGRWLSADWSAVPAPVPYANLTNPQTLNLYVMVSDDPESFADLDGHIGRPNGEEILGQYWDLYMAPSMPSSLTPAEMEALAAQQATQQLAQTPAQVTQQQPQTQQQMSLSTRGLDFIKSYEKFSATPYNDQAGNPTIGYGHKILPGENFTQITQADATKLLAGDVGNAVSAVNKSLKASVTQNQFDALVSLTFNAGAVAVRPTNTIMREINGGQVVRQTDFTAYNHVRNKAGSLVVSPGLTKRRLDEYKIFATGNYQRSP
jgi:RHS repeat-associated protein